MMLMLRSMLPVWLGLLLLRWAAACSEVFLNNQTIYPAVVSARNYDFFDQFPLDIVSYVAGDPVQLGPIDGCKPSPLSGATAKYSFVLATVARDLVTDAVARACPNGFQKAYFGGPGLDGLNSAGLSVGDLTDQASTLPIFSTNVTNSNLPALYFYDLPAYILSQFATVEDIRKHVTPDKMNIVNNPIFQRALENISTILATRVDHWTFADASGDYAVLEFQNATYWTIRNNPLGVTTNSPNLEGHISAFRTFQRNAIRLRGPAAGVLVTPGFLGNGWATSTSENDNANSISRSTTLAVLRAAVYEAFNDPTRPLSPASNPNPAHQAYVQAHLMIGWVTVPGQWPNVYNNVTGPNEMTVLQFIRDHKNLKYFVRVSNNLHWSLIDLHTVFNSYGVQKRTGVMVLPVTNISKSTMAFYTDISDMLI